MLKRLEQANKIWKKGETNESQRQSSLTFDVCNTAADPASKRLWFNLAGLIYEKTKCVFTVRWYRPRLRSKLFLNQSCMDSIQKQFYGPVRSNNARQNKLSGRFWSDQPYALAIRYHLKCNVHVYQKSLYLMNMNYSHCKASTVTTGPQISVWFPNIWDQAILHQIYQDTGVLRQDWLPFLPW